MAGRQPVVLIGFGTVVIVALVHCGAFATSSVVRPDSTRVAAGLWGGEHVGLTVTNTGGHVEFDCASGQISQPLMLDSVGRFSVEGIYVQERPGPVRIEDEPERKAASYSGRVDGKSMALNVTLVESTQDVGSFTLTYDAEPRVRKCR